MDRDPRNDIPGSISNLMIFVVLTVALLDLIFFLVYELF